MNSNDEDKDNNEEVTESVQTIEIKDFDDVFKYIGGWGPFQVMIVTMYIL